LLGGTECLYGAVQGDGCAQGLALFQELDDRRGIAFALGGLAWSALHSGEYAAAKRRFQDSLALFRQAGELEGTITCLHGLGYVCGILGEFEQGRKHHLEMLELCQATGNRGGVARAVADLGIDAYGLRQYEEANELFTDSLVAYRELGNTLGIANELADLAEAANALRDYTRAEQHAREALSVFREGVLAFDQCAWEYRNLGNAASGLGNLADARRYLRQALQAAVAAQTPTRQPLTLLAVARVLARQGEEEKALELLALVMSHRFSWQMAKDQAAPLVAELEAELPPDVVAAALERGRARDLDATVAELLSELAE
jgi:tetratricopeptide (TPR) repeat protein